MHKLSNISQSLTLCEIIRLYHNIPGQGFTVRQPLRGSETLNDIWLHGVAS